MSDLGFRRIDDQITYYGTLDDVVYRYPWGPGRHGRTLDLHALQGQLVTAAIYDKTVVINDGYLIANPLLIPDLRDVSRSLIGTMLKGGAAYLYARGGEARLVAGMEKTAKAGAGVKTHAAVRHGLERLEHHARGEIIPWPRDKNMGHVFYLLMRSIRERSGAQTATSVPNHLRADFDAIFRRFEADLDKNFDQARTLWEENAWIHFRGRDLDGTTLGTGNFTVEELRGHPEYDRVRAMMNVANEMYHLAQSSGAARSLELTLGHPIAAQGRTMGVATALVDDHEGLLAPQDPGDATATYAALNQLMLSIPPDLRFSGDFTFIESLRSDLAVATARHQYLGTLWSFANGNETFDNAAKARDRYARCLSGALHGHVMASRTLRYVEQLTELIIATATAPLSPVSSWLLGIGKDSLKNRLIERVSRRRLFVALGREAISAAQDHTPVMRDLGLYIGPLAKRGVDGMLAQVGPHPSARPPEVK